MKIKFLIFLLSFVLNNSADASWVPGRINKDGTPTSHETPSKGTEEKEDVAPPPSSSDAPGAPIKTTAWMKATPQDPKKIQEERNPFTLQQLSYLGQIVGTDYKDENKTRISGFKIKIINVSHKGDVSMLNKEVYLPYVVIIKKELVTTPEVRNSGGTELGNLAINLNTLIEFDNITSVVQPTKTWGELRVIPKRPLVSNVKAPFSKL
ncbi:MAG: hypothetical protein K2X53_05020 [Alphaproteobacteria bacterium]|nr:hypothetical protein [Alphaproteobacteria bacterium]